MLSVIIATYRKKLILSVAFFCFPYAAVGMDEQGVGTSEPVDFKKNVQIPHRRMKINPQVPSGTEKIIHIQVSPRGERINNHSALSKKEPSNQLPSYTEPPNSQLPPHKEEPINQLSPRKVGLHSPEFNSRPRRMSSSPLLSPQARQDKSLRRRSSSGSISRSDNSYIAQSESTELDLFDKFKLFKFLPSKGEKLMEELPTLLEAMNPKNFVGKSITDLELLRSQFYRYFMENESTSPQSSEINFSGANIKSIDSKELLNKFWNSKNNIADSLRDMCKLPLSETNKKSLKDNIELITASVTFLIDQVTAYKFHSAEDSYEYKNHLYKIASICYDSLSNMSPEKQKYHYYAAKYLTLCQSYQEAWSHFIKCERERFSKYVDLNYDEELNWIIILKTNYHCFLMQLDNKMENLEKGKHFSKIAYLMQLIDTAESYSESKEEIEVRMKKVTDCYLESAKCFYTDNSVEAIEEVNKWEKDILFYLHREALAKDNTGNAKLLRTISEACLQLLINAADQGDGMAQFFLGEKYLSPHEGMPQNYEEASKWYGKAITQGNEYAKDKFGFLHEEGYREIKDEKALYNFCLLSLKATETMDPEAQFILGEMYCNGTGVVHKNYEQAFKWYGKSAAGGNKDACFALGIMHSTGQGMQEDPQKAFEYFTKAAEGGHICANETLAKMYSEGFGVEENSEKSVNYYEQAAKEGSGTAQLALAQMYAEGHGGVTQNHEKAFELYKKAADQGKPAAQWPLAEMYEKGLGTEKNEVEAFKLYKEVGERGEAKAQFKIGQMCAEGRGVKQNDKEAFKWYEKAADQEHVEAKNAVISMYQQDLGMPDDTKNRLKWYENAAALGNLKATVRLGKMYYKGLGVKQDFKEAFKYYNGAAEQGNATAQVKLALMYKRGHGVQKDYKMAFELCQKSANQGNASAEYGLGYMYAKGYGTEKNEMEAKRYYELSAQKGYTKTQRKLGHKKTSKQNKLASVLEKRILK